MCFKNWEKSQPIEKKSLEMTHRMELQRLKRVIINIINSVKKTIHIMKKIQRRLKLNSGDKIYSI